MLGLLDEPQPQVPFNGPGGVLDVHDGRDILFHAFTRLNAISWLRLPSSAGYRYGEVEHHGAGVAIGLLAALEALRELAAKGLELGELLIDRLDPLPEQARHAPALARGPKLVVPRQLAYVLQRQTKGLSLANEEEPARVSIAVHPVP